MSGYFYYMVTDISQLIPQKTITSFELANISGRRHDVLIKSIERMNEDLIKMNHPPAVEDIYTSKNNIKSRQYILSIYHCELLAIALDWIARIKVLDKIEELRKPLSLQEMTLLVIEWQKKEIQEMKDKILIDAPKVHFAETISASSDSVLIREYANLCYNRDHPMYTLI